MYTTHNLHENRNVESSSEFLSLNAHFDGILYMSTEEAEGALHHISCKPFFFWKNILANLVTSASVSKYLILSAYQRRSNGNCIIFI